MLDEHFMRDWNAVHTSFASGLDRAFRRLRQPATIESTYDKPAPPPRGPGRAAEAMLHGLAAVIITAALFTAGLTVLTAPYPVLAAGAAPVVLA